MPSGRIKTGRTTMQDIADRLNISKVSVSKALNSQPGVSDELRQQILQTAQEMDYARTPASKPIRFAFVVSKHFFLETDAFYSEMYYHFNNKCVSLGFSATLIIVSGTGSAMGLLPPQLQKGDFDSVIVAGEMPDVFLQALTSLDLPITLLDFDSRALEATTLLTDNYHWGYLVTQYLIDLGHRKIGFVGQPGATGSITDRYFGYCRALLMNGLPRRDEWQLVNNDPETGVYQAIIPLPDELPTAFVCHCDMAAHYLIMALNVKGIRCPEDVSVLSFDNTRLAQTTQPTLTSVNIDTRAFAYQALTAACDMLQNRDKSCQRLYIPAGLVVRDSTAAPTDRAEP